MLNVAIVGTGNISRVHLESWEEIPEAKLVSACDIRPEKVDPVAEKYGCRAYYDLQKMLDAEKGIDILDICLPTYLHADTAVLALARGINVLTEKPLSLRREDVRRVYEAASKNNKRFMVAQVLRFWKEYQCVAEAYRTQKYGKLLSGTMTRLGNTPKASWDGWMRDPERSGLVPFDLHIHDLDFIVSVFGKPLSVHCDRARNERQDDLHATYRYDGFFFATEAAWYDCTYKFTSGFRFQFEQAVMEFKSGVLTVYHSDGTCKTLEEEEQGEAGAGVPKSSAYYNEIRYFASCVLDGADCDRIKPWELEETLDLIQKLNT